MTPDDVRLLRSPATASLLAEATAEVGAGADVLALGTRLRRSHDAALVALVMQQAELRARATGKLAHAAELLLTRDGLEQASSTAAAGHKARRLAGSGAVTDLCCGIGGDLMELAPGRAAIAVDRDPVHAAMAAHNAGVAGGTDVTAVVADVRSVDLTDVMAVHVDPARRVGWRRTLSSTEPPMAWCVTLAERVPAVVVKAAPGLDVASVPAGWEVEFLAEGRDLTQAVLWSPALADHRTRATVLPGSAELTPTGARAEVREPGAWLVDPSPAVTRAGLVGELAAALGAWQVDERIAFLSCDTQPVTELGRVLRVDTALPWDETRLREVLRARGVGSVDLRRRGLAGDVDVIRRRLRLRGDAHAVVAMTRVRDQPYAFVCTPVERADSPA
jgi:hypothetical protein